jgi:hypothetical protein
MPPDTCVHADVDFLRSAQLADDEIAVCVYMAADGRCPICKPEHEDAYTEAVRFRREGHNPTPSDAA